MESINADSWPTITLPRGTLDRLAQNPCCGYSGAGPPMTEPTALAAMALMGRSRFDSARKPLLWLAEHQSEDGSLGVDADTPQPRWPTGWALLAWQSANRAQLPADQIGEGAFTKAELAQWVNSSRQAIKWIRWLYGHRSEQTEIVEHNTQLRGWPWVDGTHSWVEPTAINVLALKAAGLARDPRVREAIEMLLDRMLPEGGWNLGNTVVMGNTLRPHVQPTGLTLAALRGESAAEEHVQKSLAYLRRAVSERTTTTSLCYALLGAAAHGTWLDGADRWIVATATRNLKANPSPYKLALLELAAMGPRCPWFT